MSKSRKTLAAVLVVLFLAQGAFQQAFLWNTWKKRYAPENLVGGGTALDPSQFLAAMAGFREMVAGILWVRADSFFDSGNYDAILPIIRLVTILDPHQIDVYATGMWHIGYNFTDEEQRSDRRYLPTAIALGTEGARKNPDTYELYFETGWMWMHKVDDIYPKAVSWMEAANAHSDIPTARKNMLAKAYERNGSLDKMLDLYYKLYDDAASNLKSDPAYQNRQSVDTISNNLDNLLVRMVQRGYIAEKNGTYAKGDYDTKDPVDVGLSAKVTVIQPMVIRVEGTWNVLPLGTRIKFILRDSDFQNTIPGGVYWDKWPDVQLDPDKNETYLQEQLYVRNDRFNKKIDMSKDPTMYPLKKDTYLVEFFYNPRSAPPHLQDKFGWNGEGITDKNFLSSTLEGRDGVRCIYATLTLTRDQLKRKGAWADKVPVVKTKNYKEITDSSDDSVILVPSMRG